MNNFRFTKSPINTELTTTNSRFIKMTELERIERIHDNMGTMFNTKKEIKPIEIVKQDNNDIFKKRIDAMNNIKKD